MSDDDSFDGLGDDGIEIVIVLAAAANGVIGHDNAMPWRLPTDMKHFRELTMGKPVVMGRKTFLSLGKPLAGRTNIVVTRDRTFAAEGAVTVASLEDGVRLAGAIAERDGVDEIIIGGGGEIYAQALDFADRVELTRVAAEPDGRVLFPELDPGIWQETARSAGVRGERDSADFTFMTFRRRRR